MLIADLPPVWAYELAAEVDVVVATVEKARQTAWYLRDEGWAKARRVFRDPALVRSLKRWVTPRRLANWLERVALLADIRGGRVAFVTETGGAGHGWRPFPRVWSLE